MPLQSWVYHRNLSNNPQSPFRSDEGFMHQAGCFVSGLVGLVFLGLVVICLFSPEWDKERNLFITFAGLCAIFGIISLLYTSIPWCNKCCRSSKSKEQDGHSRKSLLSSEEVSSKFGITGYQACAGYPRAYKYQGVPGDQAGPSYQAAPSYQTAPSYQDGPRYQAGPFVASYGVEGSDDPALACFRTLANYDGVFAHQQIPIYQQDLVESQLPPYPHGHKQHNAVPKYDVHVL